MHQSGGMQEFDCSTERDEAILRRAKHVADQEPQRWSDALATGSQDLLQRGAQVRVPLVRLCMKAGFHELQLLLNR